MKQKIDYNTALKRQTEFKAIMKKHGLTYAETAKRLNKSRHQIDKYCRVIRDDPRSGYVAISEELLFKFKVIMGEYEKDKLKTETA